MFFYSLLLILYSFNLSPMKEHLWWIIALLGSAGLLILLVMMGGRGPSGTLNTGSGNQPPATGTLVEAVGEYDHVRGTTESSVQLVEYSDFQCPACGAYHPLLKRVSEEFPDIQFVYRHFPLRSIHPNAQPAAQAAEAAALQGRFWEMHDSLFETQREWSAVKDSKDYFVTLAESLGLNKEQFLADFEADEVKKMISDDYNSGTRSNVQGTPSLYLNGQKINSPGSYDELKTLIENARADATSQE